MPGLWVGSEPPRGYAALEPFFSGVVNCQALPKLGHDSCYTNNVSAVIQENVKWFRCGLIPDQATPHDLNAAFPDEGAPVQIHAIHMFGQGNL